MNVVSKRTQHTTVKETKKGQADSIFFQGKTDSPVATTEAAVVI